MYGYILAIVGSILLFVILAVLFASGTFRSTKSPREDIKRGSTYAEPLEDEVNLSQIEEIEDQPSISPSTPEKEKQS